MKTTKERQQALRKRRADLGLKELRGVWVSDTEEKQIKLKIKELLKKLRGEV